MHNNPNPNEQERPASSHMQPLPIALSLSTIRSEQPGREEAYSSGDAEAFANFESSWRPYSTAESAAPLDTSTDDEEEEDVETPTDKEFDSFPFPHLLRRDTKSKESLAVVDYLRDPNHVFPTHLSVFTVDTTTTTPSDEDDVPLVHTRSVRFSQLPIEADSYQQPPPSDYAKRASRQLSTVPDSLPAQVARSVTRKTRDGRTLTFIEVDDTVKALDFREGRDTQPPKEEGKAAMSLKGKKRISQAIAHAELSKMRRPWFTWSVLVIQLIVFTLQLWNNSTLLGSWVVNPRSRYNHLIGPSQLSWIRTGAMYTPCMRANTTQQHAWFSVVPGIDNATLSDVCGGLSSSNNRSIAFVDDHTPDQYFRLFTSPFNHVGIVHLVLSMALQWMLLEGLEKRLGSTRISTVYLYAAIMGNLFAAATVPAVRVYLGPGGALFGIVACYLLCCWYDTQYSLNNNEWPALKYAVGAWALAYILLGLAPGIENMTSIGGFISGCLCSLAFVLPQLQLDRLAKKAAELEAGMYSNLNEDTLPIKKIVRIGMVAMLIWTSTVVLAFTLRDFANDPTHGLAGAKLGCVDAEACSVFQGSF